LIVGLDPHAGRDRWCIYTYFEGTLAHDLDRYPSSEWIRERLSASGFARFDTFIAQRVALKLDAETALREGRLDKGAMSQLADLDAATYQHGIDAIRAAIADAASRGERITLEGDLSISGTVAWND
jgi:hypothetical protein